MILIDSNALVLFLIGSIDIRWVGVEKHTSIYDEQDYYELVDKIQDINKLVVLPNVWTEVDNLLNRTRGNRKYVYLQLLIKLIKESTEEYLKSSQIENDNLLDDLGLTDILLLRYATQCNLLITGDSTLSDHAKANGVKVYDIKRRANER